MTIGARRRLSVFLVAILSVMMVPLATARAVFDGLPDFSKQFSPDTIGPGGVSTLTFTIDNSDEVTAATLIAFSDVLPVAITIATPANVVSTCPDGGGRGDPPPVITAPNGGGTISLIGGSLGAGASCTISVDVTSSTVGTHTNTTGDLTSSVGNSGTASDDLTVTGALPSFSKR
jgi:hypothetical protein